MFLLNTFLEVSISTMKRFQIAIQSDPSKITKDYMVVPIVHSTTEKTQPLRDNINIHKQIQDTFFLADNSR